MKKRNRQPDRLDPLTRDALAWILRLKSGEATLADAERLMDWRATSPAHETAYRGAVKCWQALGRTLAGPPPLSDNRRRRKTETTPRS